MQLSPLKTLQLQLEGIFHQVQVPENDRNLLRFLWWPEGEVDKPLETYCMRVHLFGAMSSPSCTSYALKRTAENDGVKYNKEVTSTILHNFFMWMTCSSQLH